MNLFKSSTSEMKNKGFGSIRVWDEKQTFSSLQCQSWKKKILQRQNPKCKKNVFTTIMSEMTFPDEVMMNSNHDHKVFEWVANLLTYLLTSLLTNGVWCVNEWVVMCERVTFHAWTNDIWHVDEWCFLSGWNIFYGRRMTCDMWANDIWWIMKCFDILCIS